MARRVVIVEPKALQAGCFEMLGQGGWSPCRSEKAQAGRRVIITIARQVVRQSRCSVLGEQAFGRDQSASVRLPSCSAGNDGGIETPRRQLGPGNADLEFAGPRLVPRARNRGQKIALARVQQRIVGQRAGRDDSRDFSLDQPFGLLRVFDLFAYRCSAAGGDDLAQVAVQLVVRESGHGDRVFALIPTG